MEVKRTRKEGAEARKRRRSCAEEEVCVNSMMSRIRNLKKTLDQAGVIRDEPLTGTNYLDPACQRQRRNHAFRDHPGKPGAWSRVSRSRRFHSLGFRLRP